MAPESLKGPARTRGPAAQQISRRSLFLLTGIGSVSLLTACADDGPASSTAETSLPAKVAEYGVDPARLAMTVYKDPSCGCCGGWVEHAQDNGFSITTEHPAALHEVWSRHDIPLDLQSCHLALNPDGAVFVGHVPARFVLEYLADPPKGARGLSVPAMPVGTPGMEQGDEFDPYEVMLITDGKPSVFADVRKPSQQRT